MKNVFIALFILIVLVSVLYKNMTWSVADKKFEYIAIHYPSGKNCKHCKSFKHNIFKVSWLYNRYVVFATYTSNMDNASQKIIQKNNFFKICQKEKKRDVLILYKVDSKKSKVIIKNDESFEVMEEKIGSLL